MDAIPQYGQSDEVLFHYRSGRTAIDRILGGGALRFAAYSQMRDPLEAKQWQVAPAYFVPDQDPDEVHNHAMEHVGQLLQLKATTKLLSLTQDAPGYEGVEEFGRGYARASLWEHYGDKHRGVCLAFDKQVLSAEIAKCLSSKGVRYEGPVIYSKDGSLEDEDPHTLSIDTTHWQDPSTRTLQHVDQHARSLLFTKLADWENEHEYRFALMGHDAAESHLLCPFGDALRAVILGHEFPQARRNTAVDAAHAYGAAVLQLRWEFGRPTISPVSSVHSI